MRPHPRLDTRAKQHRGEPSPGRAAGRLLEDAMQGMAVQIAERNDAPGHVS